MERNTSQYNASALGLPLSHLSRTILWGFYFGEGLLLQFHGDSILLASLLGKKWREVDVEPFERLSMITYLDH